MVVLICLIQLGLLVGPESGTRAARADVADEIFDAEGAVPSLVEGGEDNLVTQIADSDGQGGVKGAEGRAVDVTLAGSLDLKYVVLIVSFQKSTLDVAHIKV